MPLVVDAAKGTFFLGLNMSLIKNGKRVGSDWAQLFGIPIESLGENQLKHMDFQKLIEFLDVDPRVERVLGDKIAKASAEDLSKFKYFSREDLKEKPYVLLKYNESLREREEQPENNNLYSGSLRSCFVFWELLDEENKRNEFERFSKGKSTIIDDSSIDYSWLYENYPELALSTAVKVLKSARNISSHYDYYNSAYKHMVGSIPKEMADVIMPLVFEQGKHIFSHALSCPHISDKMTVTALRAISNRRVGIPEIKVPITKAILDKLPPVMRLNCLNTMLFESPRAKNIKFVDIKTEDDIKALLFSSMLRHHGKVERIVRKFKQMFITEKKQNE